MTKSGHPIFGQIIKNTTIILIYMGKIKGFLFAVRHREILMTDLGLNSEPGCAFAFHVKSCFLRNKLDFYIFL